MHLFEFKKSPQTAIQTDIKSQTLADDLADRRTKGHIILLLTGFEPVARGCMHYVQLWAAQMNFYFQFKSVFPNKTLVIIYIYLKKLRSFTKKSFKKN